ncbi:DUF1559 domain-containing protein [Stieleria sp. TO1_6]|uniref:DUF1559 family PulG-like putative transporter n=1 Tax=Stieleria tagensis TaxID=2956795 RepID=UPI00209BB0F1|nr:DUF1559 domain-containing protein [Stieleria tagensis]MCO8123818.1 DUF1559 domain-containing protein [Stieleria tagensis]
MPYLFTCPHCQAKTRVEDRYSGTSGECFSCGSPIDLPKFAARPAANTTATKGKRSIGVFIAAGIVLTLLLCLVFAVIRFGGSGVARLAEARLQSASIKNLELIAAALNAYAADHGKYPPAILRDSQGRALHSWRVLILPYLGQQETYDLFDLSKPWDHELNLQASYMMPDVYAHPADVNQMGGQSGYYLITGPGTLFPPTGPLSPNTISDNPSQTILVIAGMPPINNTIGGWAKPIDLDFSRMNGVINGTAGIEAGGHLKNGATMATVDGRGHYLSNDLPPTTFNALVTPNGNEPLADDTLD